MTKRSERKQVIQDEADAETAYQASLEQARRHADVLAADAAISESKRAAAAEASRALRKVEEARQRAQQEAEPEVAKRTFWQWLVGD